NGATLPTEFPDEDVEGVASPPSVETTTTLPAGTATVCESPGTGANVVFVIASDAVPYTVVAFCPVVPAGPCGPVGPAGPGGPSGPTGPTTQTTLPSALIVLIAEPAGQGLATRNCQLAAGAPPRPLEFAADSAWCA